MKVVFFSNYLTHHQIPISNELYKKLNGNYWFVSTIPMEEERVEGGWQIEKKYPYEVQAYKDDEQMAFARKLMAECDVMIIGAAPREFWITRLDLGKLTIIYSERYFKKGTYRLLDPREVRSHYRYDFKYRNNTNLHMLCAGAYTARDCKLLMSYPNRMYKWGYFPQPSPETITTLLEKKRKNMNIEILWASRFISWKHPRKAIKVMEKLHLRGYKVRLTMVGTGPLLSKCKELVEEKNLQDIISFTGAVSPEIVQQLMEKCDIFLHTADRNEGWGAVVNEAMSNACVVVADKMVGAVPYLIESGNNGYSINNKTEMYVECMQKIIVDNELREMMALNAYKTISQDLFY